LIILVRWNDRTLNRQSDSERRARLEYLPSLTQNRGYYLLPGVPKVTGLELQMLSIISNRYICRGGLEQALLECGCAIAPGARSRKPTGQASSVADRQLSVK